ncbi:MAG: HAMP domain-containing protein [Acidobacteria bacterium]|nr:HAMP domain-containing protein [Acidobacteriota bacterium]
MKSAPLQSARIDARRPSLRTRLFVMSALLSTAILLIAAWVINVVVVRQARQQVQVEIETLLPIYNAVWEENARSLAAIGTTMANSPIAKVVFGNERAAQDKATIHEMVADLTSETTAQVDLVVITDGAGKVIFAERNGADYVLNEELQAARQTAHDQKQTPGFALFGGRLYQLILTPILLQSGNDQYQNTLAVLGTGAELNRNVAQTIKDRIHSDVVFLLADRIYASSLTSESDFAPFVNAAAVQNASVTRPSEIKIGGDEALAFSRSLTGFGGESLGRVVMIRSLESIRRLFRLISNLLLLLWTGSIAAAFLLSYLMAGRIVRPIESLIQSARVVGSGNYQEEIKVVAQGELGELATAFDQMRRSLKQSQSELLKRERLAAIGQMASSIVHDLRNPLAAISTAAEMLNRDGLSLDRRKTLVESQMRASKRMQDMLRELLDFTLGKYNLALEHHRLAALIEKAVRSLRANYATINIETDIPSEIVVTVDGERIRRVFENLLNNAAQALSTQAPAPKIIVHAVVQNATVRLDVIDNGTGVPDEIRERLFEPFVSHGKLGGTGLGLAIAKSIVEAHGGTIGYEAIVTGADFYVRLPLHNIPSNAPQN